MLFFILRILSGSKWYNSSLYRIIMIIMFTFFFQNNYEPISQGGAQKEPKEDPSQAIYSELGPGGRVGPKPTPNQSNYAEVKLDDEGYPITGDTQSPPEMSIYDRVKRDSDDFSDNGIIV